MCLRFLIKWVLKLLGRTVYVTHNAFKDPKLLVSQLFQVRNLSYAKISSVVTILTTIKRHIIRVVSHPHHQLLGPGLSRRKSPVDSRPVHLRLWLYWPVFLQVRHCSNVGNFPSVFRALMSYICR